MNSLSLSFLQEQRSKVFNVSMGYEFDEKLYKSLYDVCLLLIIATCTNNSINNSNCFNLFPFHTLFFLTLGSAC